MSKTISISCIDTLNYEKTVRAINSTINCINITKVYWLSDIDVSSSIPVPVVWNKIDKFNRTNFEETVGELHLRTIPSIVDTDFNIIVHYDGFAINKNAWTDEFLEYDYIGAIWTGCPENQSVGNGGFSLRSKRLYAALLDMNAGFKLEHFNEEDRQRYSNMGISQKMIIPEDVIISKVYRPILEQKYDIKFAPTKLADQWSIEHNFSSEWLGKSLGFHGKHGIQNHYGVTL